MYKLIVTDMDGTLLNSEKKVGQKNLDYILKAQEKGLKFVLASGRVEEAMLPIAKELQMDKYEGYVLSYNGARIIDCKTNEIIYDRALTKKDIEYLYTLSNKFNIALVTYINKELFYNKEHKYVDIEEKITGFKKRLYKDTSEINTNKVGKCMFIGDTEKTKKLLEYITKKDSDKYFATLSDPHFLEILHKDVSKGRSLKKLADILNIDIKDTIACGDSYNDIDMLEVAGLSVAAFNGVDDVKRISDYISVSNNDGVLADVIEKYGILAK